MPEKKRDNTLNVLFVVNCFVSWNC